MPPAIAAAVVVAGGIAGAIERSNAGDEVKKSMRQRLDEYERAGTPPNSALPLVLQEFKQQGILTPELEKQINVEASKVAQIQEDPKLRQAVVQGLQLLQSKGEQGFTAEDQAAFSKARTGAAKESQGRLQSILQQMHARGMGGSGAELAAQLSASQAGDTQLADQGEQIAADRAKASRDAIQQMITGSGQLRTQDFNIANTKAQAADELNRFRVGLEANQQARNVQSQNRAQELNLATAQHIADMNTQLTNAEKLRQRQAALQDWQNKVGLAQAKGGIYQDQGQQAWKEGAANAQGYAQIGQGLGSAVTAYGARNVGSTDNSGDANGIVAGANVGGAAGSQPVQIMRNPAGDLPEFDYTKLYKPISKGPQE